MSHCNSHVDGKVCCGILRNDLTHKILILCEEEIINSILQKLELML